MTADERAQRRLDRQMLSPTERARWLARREEQLRRIAAHYRRTLGTGSGVTDNLERTVKSGQKRGAL